MKLKAGEFDIVVLGHISLDYIVTPRQEAPMLLGGPPTYVGITASLLNVKVAIVSKVGPDFKDEYILRYYRAGIDVEAVERTLKPTTRYKLIYSNGGRKLQLLARCESIMPHDIPTSLKARAVHVAPIIQEVPYETVEALSGRFPLLSIDPQGFARSIGYKGFVRVKDWLEAPKFLSHFQVYKSSLQELKAATGFKEASKGLSKILSMGPRVAMATMGIRGILLKTGKGLFHIPACKPKVVEDPTGAGDAFIGGFLAEYIKTGDELWSACIGSACASFTVEGLGPSSFGSKPEVEERASLAYQKVVKV